MKKLDLWIGGEFRPAQNNAVFVDCSPVDDSPYAEAARAYEEDVKLAVEVAHAH